MSNGTVIKAYSKAMDFVSKAQLKIATVQGLANDHEIVKELAEIVGDLIDVNNKILTMSDKAHKYIFEKET